MSPCLRMPFPSFSADNFISRGAAGHVFHINSDLVFKCPTRFDDAFPDQLNEMEESVVKIEKEKGIYQILIQRPHPNIVQCILCVPQGIFLRRMVSSLQDRLPQSHTAAMITPHIQERWVWQLTSAVAWLEHLGLVHGDLRPANILLDTEENIRICDFDATVKPGSELLVGGGEFCKMNEKFETPLAGAITEQFALASCIYTIRFGHCPWHELEPRARALKMIENEFPPVSEDLMFGEVITACWLGGYSSIAAVEQDLRVRLGRTLAEHQETRQAALLKEDAARYLELRAECEEFLVKQARRWQRRSVVHSSLISEFTSPGCIDLNERPMM